MTGKDAGYVKTERLSEMARFMAKSIADGIDKESLLDWVEINIGLTRTTATSYVDLLVRAKGWYEDEGTILCEIPTQACASG